MEYNSSKSFNGFANVVRGGVRTALVVSAIAAFRQGYYLVSLKRKPKDRCFIRQCRHYKRIISESDLDGFRYCFASCCLATLELKHSLRLNVRKVRIPPSDFVSYHTLCLIRRNK